MSTTMIAAVHLQWECGCLEEHQFRKAQDVVRHHSEVDLGSGL